MEKTIYEGKVLWSQIDANLHLRHSAYADFGAHARLQLIEVLGFTHQTFDRLDLGPILFREEVIYMREVLPNDSIKIITELSKCRMDGSRWSFRQKLFRGDGVQAAQINSDGAWMYKSTRKLRALPEEWTLKFFEIPKTEDFIEEPIPKKN